MNYYLYYRRDPASAGSSRAKVQAIFDAIERGVGVRGRWMRRRDDASTFMEVYEGVQDVGTFEALLTTEGARLGVERKVERFVSA